MHKRDIFSKMYNLGEDETMGEVVMSLKEVYAETQAGRPLQQKWFILANEDNYEEQRGWVMLSVTVFGVADPIPSRVSLGKEVDQEEQRGAPRNLKARAIVSPDESAEFSTWQMHFVVWYAEDLKMPPQSVGLLGDQLHPYVEATYGGMTPLYTSVRPYTSDPLFNEDLRFPMMVPNYLSVVDVRVFSDGGVFGGGSTQLARFNVDLADLARTHAVPPFWKYIYAVAPEVTAAVDKATAQAAAAGDGLGSHAPQTDTKRFHAVLARGFVRP